MVWAWEAQPLAYVDRRLVRSLVLQGYFIGLNRN